MDIIRKLLSRKLSIVPLRIVLYAFLENHKILFENQFGIRKNNSTTHALMEITEKESIDRGKFGCGIFIDLRKAFDTVNHDILIKN